MKELIGTARNLMLAASDDGEPRAMIEVILILTEPNFRVDAVGQMIRERSVETARFSTTAKGLRAVAKDYLAWADEADAFLMALKLGVEPEGGGA